MEGEHRGDFSFDDTDPYKIIEGASYSLAVHYDKELDHYLDSVINIIAKAQEPDGYLTTCVTNKCTRLSGWWGSHRWEKRPLPHLGKHVLQETLHYGRDWFKTSRRGFWPQLRTQQPDCLLRDLRCHRQRVLEPSHVPGYGRGEIRRSPVMVRV